MKKKMLVLIFLSIFYSAFADKACNLRIDGGYRVKAVAAYSNDFPECIGVVYTDKPVPSTNPTKKYYFLIKDDERGKNILATAIVAMQNESYVEVQTDGQGYAIWIISNLQNTSEY